MKRTLYVVPNNTQGGWDVREEQFPDEAVFFASKQEAIAHARRISSARDDIQVINQAGELNWDLARNESGTELFVWDERDPLPPEVRKAMDENPSLKGIPQGQIQPKKGR